MVDKEQLVSMVRDAQQGVEGAATRLYNAFRGELYSYILNTVNNPDLAEDLTQNAFMEIFMSIGKLEEPAAFPAWSKRIAYHQCTAYFRKRHELLADEAEDLGMFDAIEENREEFIPGEALDREDLKNTLQAMLDALPAEQRNAIIMRYFEELPVREIARRQGVTEGTVKSRLNYGRQAIRRAIEAYEKKHNIKLHSTSVPMLLWLFQEQQAAGGISLTAQVTSAALTADTVAVTSTALTATTATGTANAVAGAGTALTTKVIAGITAVAVSVGGVTAAVIHKTDRGANTAPPTTTLVSRAPELSFVLSSDGSHYEVRGVGTFTGSEIVIPSEYNGLPVSAIAPYAFMDCSHITSITLPDSLVRIGEQAFSGCAGLTEFSLPQGVTELSVGSFMGCTELRELSFPQGLTAIGDAAFWGCEKLQNTLLPDSLDTIGAGAFYDCRSLTGLTLPAGVAHIGDHAFTGCTGLQTISVSPENPVYHSAGNCLIDTGEKTLILGCRNSILPTDGSITAIAPSAFDQCESLRSVTIPTSITVIHATAFYGCKNLTDIYYPGTMSQWDGIAHNLDTDGIGDYTVHCTEGIIYQGIHQAAVPESLQGLTFTLSEDGSFYRVTPTDSAAAEPVIPAVYKGLPVRQISFFACEALRRVVIPDSITEIQSEAFAFCGDLSHITLPDTLTSIGASAFNDCGSLTQITIPLSVTELGARAFNGCSALTDIDYPGTIAQWNALQKGSDWDDRTGQYTIHCADGDLPKELPQAILPEGSEGLSYTLNNDGISYTLSGIGSCTDAEIRIPAKHNGLPVTAIGEETFYGNKTVTAIFIPETVTRLDSHILGENPKLERLTVDAGNPVFHSSGNCIVETETKTLIVGCQSSRIPEDGSVARIGDHAFYAKGLTAVSVPEGVTEIGEAAFSRNTDLTHITLPGSILQISGNLLNLCTGLTDITYTGTMAQWEALQKGSFWDYDTGSYTVHCTDGDIPKA